MIRVPDSSESILVCVLKLALILPFSKKNVLVLYLFISTSSIFFDLNSRFTLLKMLFTCLLCPSKLSIFSCEEFCNTIFSQFTSLGYGSVTQVIELILFSLLFFHSQNLICVVSHYVFYLSPYTINTVFYVVFLFYVSTS